MARDPKTILLCSIRFWSQDHGPTNPTARATATLRSGVRHVARKQGVTPADLDKAERALIKDGLVRRPKSAAATIALTEDGLKVSRSRCEGVELPPWDWKTSYRGLAGAKKRRR